MKTEETLGEKIARVKERYPDEIARTKTMMEWRMDDADFQRVFQGIRGDSHLPQQYTKGMATACLYAIEWAVNHGMLVPRELLLGDEAAAVTRLREVQAWLDLAAAFDHDDPRWDWWRDRPRSLLDASK